MVRGLLRSKPTKMAQALMSTKPQEDGEKSSVDPRPLYLDAQSTTPLDFRVLDAMLPYLTTYYGNPHSRTHAYGWEATLPSLCRHFAVTLPSLCRHFAFTLPSLCRQFA